MIRDFSRHVGTVRGTDSDGRPVPVRKLAKSEWQCEPAYLATLREPRIGFRNLRAGGSERIRFARWRIRFAQSPDAHRRGRRAAGAGRAARPGRRHLVRRDARLAAFYSQEAVRLRLMARDLDHRALVYERLFGQESDWVSGTRLLARSYEDAARDHERTAEQHLSLIRGGRASQPEQPTLR